MIAPVTSPKLVMNKEFKKKNLNRNLIFNCLIQFGVEDIEKAPVDATKYHLKGVYQGERFLLNIFENQDGTTTIGFSSGFDRNLFELLAEEIVLRCSYGNEPRLEVSIPKFPPEGLEGLLAFLVSEGANQEDEKALPYEAIQLRLKGPTGDALTIKSYKNGTVQFQGKNAHLASLLWDYLYNVLSLEDALTKQSQTYKIDVAVDQIKSELEAKIPVAHQFIEDTVRKQLSSALMLCKIVVPLEDHAPVAFPALRGLEGFMKQVLLKSGLHPEDKFPVGSYFEPKVRDEYVLQKNYADHVVRHSGPSHVRILEESYTYYFKQRHGLFHMSTNVETSRILGSAEDAKRIVFDVLDMIENASKELCT